MTHQQLTFEFRATLPARTYIVVSCDRPTRRPAGRAGELVETRRGELQKIDGSTRHWRKYEGRIAA